MRPGADRNDAKGFVLLLIVVLLLGGTLAGCAPATPAVTERTVEVTRVIERVVTATFAPSTPTATSTMVLPTALLQSTETPAPPTVTPAPPTPTLALPAPTMGPRVTLAKGPGKPVYLIVEGLERRWFPNSQSFEAFCHEYGLGWDDLRTHTEYPELWRQTCRLPCGEPMPYYYPIPKGTLVRAAESPDVYEITTEIREGIKRQVKVLVSGEADEDEVACVSREWLDDFPTGGR